MLIPHRRFPTHSTQAQYIAMMKSLASIAPTLVTLLLATSLTNAAGAPVFQFTDFMVGSKTCRGCMQCRVGSSEPPFYPFSFVIGNDYCVDLNGIISVETTYGLLTVDFNSEAIGNTDIHLTFPNGTWIGGTAPSKSSGYSATMDTTGTGQWGTPNYVGGWCVANIIQYQKVDPSAAVTDPDGQYSYNISLYDNSRNWIGGTDGGPLFVENSQTGGIDSLLPSVFEITSGSPSFLLLPHA